MSNNEEDEDDYMSDAFLKQCESTTRPGLITGHVAKKYEREKKKKALHAYHREQYKPRSVLEKEKRDEGMKETIGSDNKGFALLAKMGYKPGMSIGREGSGRREPVTIEVKLGRGGLGREADQKRKQDVRNQNRANMMVKRQKVEMNQRHEFVQKMGSRFREKKDEADVRKSQRVCEQLDAEAGISKPSESFFWPEALQPKTTADDSELLQQGLAEGYDSVLNDEEEEREDEEEEEEEEEDKVENEEEERVLYTASEMLEMLTEYIRNTYKYCVWCGTRYDDLADMLANCPGNTADAHDE